MISVYLRTLGRNRYEYTDELLYYGDSRIAAQEHVSYHAGRISSTEVLIWHEDKICASGMTLPSGELQTEDM